MALPQLWDRYDLKDAVECLSMLVLLVGTSKATQNRSTRPACFEALLQQLELFASSAVGLRRKWLQEGQHSAFQPAAQKMSSQHIWLPGGALVKINKMRVQQAAHLDITDQKPDSLLVLAALLWCSRGDSPDTDPEGDAPSSMQSALSKHCSRS